MKNYPRIQFSSSAESEARKLFLVAVRIKECFYQNNNYRIAIKLTGIDAARQVVFPKFCSEIIPDFWQRLPPHFMYKKTDRKMMCQMIKILAQYIEEHSLIPEEERVENIKKEWEKVSDKFWEIFEQLFPGDIQKLTDFKVYITRWGSVLSFGSDINNSFQLGEICLRLDGGVEYLARGIISTIFWDALFKKEYLYGEQVVIVDFLLTETRFKDLFSHYQPFYLRACQLDEIDRKYTGRFLEKIGFNNKEIIGWRGDDLLFRGKLAKYKFSKEELNLLEYLKENNGRICSYREVGHIVWTQDYEESFSLWAINALVYRLRKKLIKNNIDARILETIKGQGFRLNDRI